MGISRKKITRAEREQLKKDYIEALNRNAGIVGIALKAIGIKSRNTIHLWRKDDPEFDAACDEANETALDMVEMSLLKNVQAGDTAAIKYYLNCKGHSRGYIEHNTLDVNAVITRPRIVYEDDHEALEREAKDYTPED